MSNLRNFLAALVSPLQEVEDAMLAILEQRSIDLAVGVQLDALGKLVGQPRLGLDDETYRRYVRARVATNRSDGNIEDVIKVSNLVVFDPDAYLEIVPEYPAALTLRVSGVEMSDELATVLISFLRDVVSAGVRILLEHHGNDLDEMFAFEGEDPGLGFGGQGLALHLERASSQYAGVTAPTGLGFTTTLTLRAWVRVSSLPGASEYYTICGKGNINGQRSYVMYLHASGSTQRLAFWSSADGAVGPFNYATVPLVVDTWHHVAVTFDGEAGSTVQERIHFYFDGIEYPITQSDGNEASIFDGTSSFEVGGRSDVARYFNGDLRNVQIYDRALTDEEIASLDFPVSTDGLQGSWPLDGSYTDFSGNGNTLTPVNAPTFEDGEYDPVGGLLAGVAE
jgi:hypothetical protein